MAKNLLNILRNRHIRSRTLSVSIYFFYIIGNLQEYDNYYLFNVYRLLLSRNLDFYFRAGGQNSNDVVHFPLRTANSLFFLIFNPW